MTGIVAVIAAASPNAIYLDGLYRLQPSGTVDLSPIDVGTLSSRFTGTISYSYEWIGYLRGVATTSIQLGANCPYQEWIDFSGSSPPQPGNWGGGGNSTCSIWTGATAISGYNSGNRTAFIQNGQSSVSFNTVTGVNYPMRIQWSTNLPYFQSGSFFVDRYWAESSFDFQINGSNAVSGQIFYNTLTNGF